MSEWKEFRENEVYFCLEPLKSLLIYISLLLLSTLAAISVTGQTSYHINTAENLNTAILTTIIRDRNNNMWIGSYNGLFNHECSRIRSFTRVGTGSKSISGGEMHTIFEDRQGFIWIGTTNGLDKINPVTYHIEHYPLRSTDSSSSFVGYIYSVFQDKNDYIWACTDAAMFRLNYTTGQYVTIPVREDKTGMPSIYVSYKSGVSTEKGLWMHTLEGLVFYEYSTGNFYHRYYNPQHNPVFSLNESGRGNQSEIRMDKKNNLWFVSNDKKLIRYNTQTEKLDSFVFDRPPNAWFCCYSISIDHKENVWIGFRHGGLLVFDSEKKSFASIMGSSINSLIKSNYIYSLEEDYRGQMWVSTDNGLDIINLYNTATKRVFLREQPDFVNLNYEMGSPSTDGSDYVYVPFYQYGFFQLNTQTDSISSFQPTTGTTSGTSYIIPFDNKKIWVARGKKLIPFDLGTGKVMATGTESFLPDSISKFKGDLIWHYKSGGDIIFKKNTGTIYYLHADGKLEIMEGYGFKKNICLSPDSGILWYINNDLNLVKRNMATQQTTIIDLQKGLKSINFSFANPRDMVDDGENIWMTSQNGLLRYEQASGKITPYTVQDGLAHSFTFSLCVDKATRLWVGSLGGIDFYDKKKDAFKNIISHPTESYMDAFGGAVMTANGKIYFASGNKLFILDPDKILAQEKNKFDLLVQEIMINGETTNWKEGNVLEDLRHRQNRILLRFGLLDFTHQKNIRYYYYMENLETDWIENITPGEISYNSLPPGKYVFHIKATDLSGNLLTDELRIPVHIHPPFWQTWWFRILSILFIVSVIFWFFRRRIKTIKTKAAIQQQMTELEAKALRAQMNPHFIFNSLNAIQELIVTKNFTEAYQYLSRFSKLLRMVLNNSEKNFIPLSAELEMNRIYLELESLRFKQSFHYELDVDPNIDEETTLVPSLLLQPFLENAIWHGLMHKDGEKRLAISFNEENNHLVCRIEDNGIGRERSAAIKAGKIGASHFESKGMSLSQQRIETLNHQLKENLSIRVEDIKDETGGATGTRIIIEIPKQKTFIN